MIRRPPKHLTKESKEFFNKIVKNYNLEDHHIKILILACDCLDRIKQAREVILIRPFYVDRFGQPKVNPAYQIESSNKILFARLIRELNLDTEVPSGLGRPPGLY